MFISDFTVIHSLILTGQKIMDQFDIHFQVAFLHKHEDVDKPVDINIILWTTSFEFLEYLY